MRLWAGSGGLSKVRGGGGGWGLAGGGGEEAVGWQVGAIFCLLAVLLLFSC